MERKHENEIRIPGFELLGKNPGPADALRPIQSKRKGNGDYTKDRKKWLESDLNTALQGIMERRKTPPE